MRMVSFRYCPVVVLLLAALVMAPQPASGLSHEEAERFRQLFNRGRRSFDLELFDVAEEAFLEAARLDPRSAHIQLYLGRTYQNRHRYKQAEEALRRGLELAPDGLETRFYLGQVLREQIRFDEALVEFRKVATADPKWSEPLYYIGHMLYQRGEYEQALEELSRSMALATSETPLASRRAVTYQLALTYQRLDNLAEAERHLRNLIDLDPEYARGYYSLAEVLERAGDEAGAEQFRARFDVLQRQDLEDREKSALFSQYGRQGLVHLDRNEPAEAIVDFETAIEIDPKQPDLHAFLGLALSRVGRLAAAIESLEIAVDLEPQQAMALTELGRLHAMKGDLQEARGYLERAVSAQPTLLEAHEFLSYVNEDLGNLEAARRELQILEELRKSGKGESIYDAK